MRFNATMCNVHAQCLLSIQFLLLHFENCNAAHILMGLFESFFYPRRTKVTTGAFLFFALVTDTRYISNVTIRIIYDSKYDKVEWTYVAPF